MCSSLLLTAVACLLVVVDARLLLPSLRSEIRAGVLALESDLLMEKPRVTFSINTNLTDARFVAGDALLFYCEAVGSPMINVYWTLNGKIIQGHRLRSNLERLRNTDKLMVGTNVVGSTLELGCVDERISGALSCIADNGFEIVKRTAHIATPASSSTSVCSRLRPARPQIGLHTKSRIEESGNDVILQCRRTPASSGARVRWETERGHRLFKKDGFLVLPSGDLLIHAVNWAHMGTYACIVSSSDGESRTETFFYPTAKEAAPTTLNDDAEYEDELI